jgi:hypothetical protein
MRKIRVFSVKPCNSMRDHRLQSLILLNSERDNKLLKTVWT